MRRWYREAFIASGIGAGSFALATRGYPLWIIGAAPAFGLFFATLRAAVHHCWHPLQRSAKRPSDPGQRLPSLSVIAGAAAQRGYLGAA